jgi:hypothetical protein
MRSQVGCWANLVAPACENLGRNLGDLPPRQAFALLSFFQQASALSRGVVTFSPVNRQVPPNSCPFRVRMLVVSVAEASSGMGVIFQAKTWADSKMARSFQNQARIE